MVLATSILVVPLADLCDQKSRIWKTPLIQTLIMLVLILVLHTYEARIRIDGRVTLPRLKPACFYDLVIEVAIVRPGPMSVKKVD
jgi:hypothetical protein